MTTVPDQARVRVLGIALFTVAALLLTSAGGAGVVAAPLTLPLMFLFVRARPTRAFRIAGGRIGGLTAAELGWGVQCAVAGEIGAATWVVPLVCGAAAASLFARR